MLRISVTALKAYKTTGDIAKRVFQLELIKRNEFIAVEKRRDAKMRERAAYFDKFAIVPFVEAVKLPPSAHRRARQFRELDDYVKCLLSGKCNQSQEALDIVSQRLQRELSFLPIDDSGNALLLLLNHQHATAPALTEAFTRKLSSNKIYREQLDPLLAIHLSKYIPSLPRDFSVLSLADLHTLLSSQAQFSTEDISRIKEAIIRLKPKARGTNLFNFD